MVAFSIQFSFAQERTITGVVTENGQPLPGVAVLIKDTQKVALTDFDGRYSISAKQGEVLEFSYTGMVTRTVVVGASNTVNVVMEGDVAQLTEVVVEGYSRTATRATSNVAVTTVSASTIEGRPNASFMQTLQGQVAGLNISSGSGQPGANSTVVLRGYGSISGNIEPLYVIDGVPLNVDNFRSLNPNDIESVSVLKDAGATAIYGNRGANGVIIVNTKRGTFKSDLSISYASTFSLTNMQKHDYRLMNAKQILATEKSVGGAYASTLSDDDIAAYAINTNWNKELFRTGTSQNHVLSLSSGGENLASFTSIGYYDMDGILGNTDIKRFNFRNNLTGKSNNDKFNYQTSFTVNYSQSNEAWALGDGSVNLNPVFGANMGLPYVSPSWYQNGQQLLDMYTGANNPYGVGTGNLALSPLILLDQFDTFLNRTNEIKGIADIRGNYKLTNEISVGSSFGLDFTETMFLRYRYPHNWTELLFRAAGEDYLGMQTENVIRTALFNANTNISYKKIFAEKHTLEATVATEYFKAHSKGIQYTQNGLDPVLSEPGAGTGFISHNPTGGFPHLYVPQVSASKQTAGLFSYFGFVDYDYDTKYGLSASVRRDASYRFSQSNRWGTFWSVSGRWNIDRESFMENSAFDMLKLRASYGTTGNQNIVGQSIFLGANLQHSLYGLAGAGYGNQPSYILGQLGNDDLKWETITQANVGIDFGVFNNRFRGSVDVYDKTTTDMYLQTVLSAVTGFTGLSANAGEMYNRGVELNLSYDLFPRESDLQLRLYGNGSYNKNRLVDVNDPSGTIDLGDRVNQNDRMLAEYYLVRYAGVNPANGNALFYTADGLLTENPDEDNDRVLTGKSPIPVYQGGFGFDMSYKGFFLTTQFNFVADIWRFDSDLDALSSTGAGEWGQFNKTTDLLNAWTEDNRFTNIPALTYNTGTYTMHDRFLTDASYLRLRFATFGYDFPKKFIERTAFNTVRVFVQGENLFTWTKWRGWDAESNRSSDIYQYPTPRIVSFGLELKF